MTSFVFFKISTGGCICPWSSVDFLCVSVQPKINIPCPCLTVESTFTPQHHKQLVKPIVYSMMYRSFYQQSYFGWTDFYFGWTTNPFGSSMSQVGSGSPRGSAMDQPVWINNGPVWFNSEPLWSTNEAVWFNRESAWVNSETDSVNHEPV